MNGDAHIGAVGPLLPVFFVQQIGLGFEVADLGQGQFDFPAAGGFLHGQIAPGSAGKGGAAGMGGDDFAAAHGGAAEVGAQARRKFRRRGRAAGAELKTDFVTNEAQQAFASDRGHDGAGVFHLQRF